MTRETVPVKDTSHKWPPPVHVLRRELQQELGLPPDDKSLHAGLDDELTKVFINQHDAPKESNAWVRQMRRPGA